MPKPIKLTELKAAAEAWFEDGANIVPVHISEIPDPQTGVYREKQPLTEWKQWIKQRQTREEFDNLPWQKCNGFAVVLGYKDCNGYYLAVVDFDPKCSLVKPAWDEQTYHGNREKYEADVEQYQIQLEQHAIAVEKGRKLVADLSASWVEKSINNGCHILFKSKTPVVIDQSVRIACKVEVLAERKICIMAPSYGYEIIEKKDIAVADDFNTFFQNLCVKHSLQTQTQIQEQKTKPSPITVRNVQQTPIQRRQFILLADEEIQQIAQLIRPMWVVGTRQALTEYLCGWFINQNIVKESAEKLVRQLCNTTNTSQNDTTEYLDNVKYQYENRANKPDLKGWTGIQQIHQEVLQYKMPQKLQNELSGIVNKIGDNKQGKKKSDERPVFTAGKWLPTRNVVFEQVIGRQFLCSDGSLQTQIEDIEDSEEIIYTPLESSKITWQLCNNTPVEWSKKQLWRDVYNYLWKHVDLPDSRLYTVLTAWVFAQWIPEKWNTVPYLFFFGALASGKTRALETIQSISYRANFSISSSPSALFRSIEKYNTTPFLDEAEVYNSESAGEIIACLNAGYKRNAGFVQRYQGDASNGDVITFRVFGFKALAGTQKLRNTLESRSIIVRMARNTRDVNILVAKKQAQQLRDRLLQWRFWALKHLDSPLIEEDESLLVSSLSSPSSLNIENCMVNRMVGEVSEDGEDIGKGGGFGVPVEFVAMRNSRVIELFLPLVWVCDDADKRVVIDYAMSVYADQREEEAASVEAEMVNALLCCREFVVGGKLELQRVFEVVNESRSPSEQFKATRQVGAILSRLGLKSTRVTSGNNRGRAGIVWDETRIQELTSRYITPFKEQGITGNFTSKESQQKTLANTSNALSLAMPEKIGKEVQQTLDRIDNKTDLTPNTKYREVTQCIIIVPVIPPAERCPVCGILAVEYIITMPQQEPQRVCQNCFTKFKEEHKDAQFRYRQKEADNND